jgi:hypothetical protein
MSTGRRYAIAGASLCRFLAGTGESSIVKPSRVYVSIAAGFH